MRGLVRGICREISSARPDPYALCWTGFTSVSRRSTARRERAPTRSGTWPRRAIAQGSASQVNLLKQFGILEDLLLMLNKGGAGLDKVVSDAGRTGIVITQEGMDSARCAFR